MRLCRPCLSAAMWLGLVLPAFGAELADFVPASAKAYVQFGDLVQAEKQVKAFAQSSGIPVPPGFDLGVISTISGLGDQWETNRGLALVAMEATNRDVALLVPVKNAQMALRQLKATEEGDYYSVTIANMPLVAMEKDRCLVLGFDQAVLQPFKRPTQTLSKVWSDQEKRFVLKSNLIVHLNIEELLPLIEQGLEFLGQTIGELRNLPGGVVPQQANPEVTAAMLKWYIKSIRSIAQQTSTVQIAFNFTPEAVSLHKFAHFKPETNAYKTVLRANSDTTVFLKKIPQEPFYVAGAMDMRGLESTVVEVVRSLWELPALAKTLSDEKTRTSMEQSIALYKQMTGWCMSIDFGKKGINGTGYYMVQNPELAMKQLHDSFELSQATFRGFAPFEIETEFTTKQVDGKDIQQFTVDFEKSPPETKELMKVLYGEKMITQIGLHNEMVGMAIGPEENPFQRLTKDTDALVDAPAVSTVVEMLPEKPLAVLLLDPFGLFRMFKRMAEVQPIMPEAFQKMQLPTQLTSPVAVALDTQETGRLDAQLVVTSSMIKHIVDTVQPAMLAR